MSSSHSWIYPDPSLSLQPTLSLRLFCLPYAGGGAMAFRQWQSGLSQNIEVCPIQLPGRENRLNEPAYSSLEQLIPALAEGISGRLDQPYILFGYSMGALIAFELARYFRQNGLPLPRSLWVAAAHAPHAQTQYNPPLYQRSDTELLDELRRFNGTPEAVLTHPELLALLLPIVRADFELLETYRYQTQEPLNIPIVALGGLRDPQVLPAAIEAWSGHSCHSFSKHEFDGDHFFMQTHREALLQLIQICN